MQRRPSTPIARRSRSPTAGSNVCRRDSWRRSWCTRSSAAPATTRRSPTHSTRSVTRFSDARWSVTVSGVHPRSVRCGPRAGPDTRCAVADILVGVWSRDLGGASELACGHGVWPVRSLCVDFVSSASYVQGSVKGSFSCELQLNAPTNCSITSTQNGDSVMTTSSAQSNAQGVSWFGVSWFGVSWF